MAPDYACEIELYCDLGIYKLFGVQFSSFNNCWSWIPDNGNESLTIEITTYPLFEFIPNYNRIIIEMSVRFTPNIAVYLNS
jgi:hypothetical protein